MAAPSAGVAPRGIRNDYNYLPLVTLTQSVPMAEEIRVNCYAVVAEWTEPRMTRGSGACL